MQFINLINKKNTIHNIYVVNFLLLITLIVLIYSINKFNSTSGNSSKFFSSQNSLEEQLNVAKIKYHKLIDRVAKSEDNNLTIKLLREMSLPIVYTSKDLDNLDNDIIDFEGFNNRIDYNKKIVPNLIHLIYLNQPFVSFYQMINIYAIYLNHRPDFIYMHCDECGFYGKYWNEINKLDNLRRIIRVHKIRFSYRIFNKPIVFIEHKSV
jgi:hypothetical protein